MVKSIQTNEYYEKLRYVGETTEHAKQRILKKRKKLVRQKKKLYNKVYEK